MAHERLMGQRVWLSGNDGPFRLCPNCYACEGKVHAGSGPHLASIRCTGCDTHISWLSRAHLDALAARFRHVGARANG